MNYGGSPYHKQRLQKKNLYISNLKLPGGLGSTHRVIVILDSELNTVGPYGPDDDDDDGGGGGDGDDDDDGGGDDDDDDDDGDDDDNNNNATNQQICM